MSDNEPQVPQDNAPPSETVTEADFDSAIAQALTDDRASSDPALVVDVEGFEGPLDLLLMLARTQKVDLSKISILALADQYLQFIEAARKLRLELAADYLVMAAWLAYLKSRLLLPGTAEQPGPSAEDMALALAHRLRRLEAFRNVAAQLMGRPQYDRDVFGRGAPEPIEEVKNPEWSATLYDLLTAYTVQRQHSALARVRFAKRKAWSLAEARAALERLIGQTSDWTRIDEYLITYLVDPSMTATVVASSFASALELVREGEAEIHQRQAFAPLFMRKRVGVGAGQAVVEAAPAAQGG
jgi:segregation and condensation protein A